MSFGDEMVDVEAVLAAELQESRRRAEELQALLDAERRRASEAETRLKDRERLLKEAQRRPIDKELADKQRAVLSQVRAQCGGARSAAICGAPNTSAEVPRASRAGPAGAQAALAALRQRVDRGRRCDSRLVPGAPLPVPRNVARRRRLPV